MSKLGQAKTRTLRSLHFCFLVLLSTVFFGGQLLAFSTAASAPTGSTPESPRRSAADDPFFKGPFFLKVVLDPRENNAIMGVPFAERLPLLRDLEKYSGTRIQISGKGEWYQDSGYFAKVLTISGDAASVVKAFSRVRPNSDREMIITFLMPHSACGQLIGIGGSSVKEAEQQTGTLIRITEVPNRQENTVDVKGMTQGIDAAVKWMLDQQDAYDEDSRHDTHFLLTAKYGAKNSESNSEIFMRLTERQGRWLVGKGGANRMKIHNMFHVFLDSRKDDSSFMRIKGCLGDVEAAHRHILYCISNLPV